MDEHPVDFDDAQVWELHVSIMREAVGRATTQPVDACFTSEAYGTELARRFGARHICVDGPRALVPVSATAVRRDPVAHWEHLAPCVRAGLALRVVVVGAESTGKSTLAEALAQALRQRGGALGLTRWVPEYGREATLDKLAQARARAAWAGTPPPPVEALAWDSPDFLAIGRVQAAREEAAARAGGPILVCDTDAFATGVWHERYLGRRSAEVESVGETAGHALYWLTHPEDVPFAQDGLRDGYHIRDWMTNRFAERLDETGRRWEWLRGDREARLNRALASIDRLVGEGWRLADPLG
jgi:NadR type nicotinamide-nucleotide adenylyltransferase